jgi:DNA-binding transcriptional regulator YhcF (GntR family)
VTARFEQIADAVAARIASGELPPGARVPSTRQLMEEWGVAMATAGKVLAELRRRRLVWPIAGVGTVVAEPAGAGRPELNRRGIIAAAVRVADAEGLDAVTIRRVAGELGAGAMSLYRHVRDKEDLHLLMRDAVFADRPLPASGPAEWRARLELSGRTLWSLYRAHPWLARTPSLTRPYAGPHQMPYSEWNLRALSDLGLDDQTVFSLHLTLFGFVHGSAASLETEAREEADSGLSGDEWLVARERQTRAVITADQYPVAARVFLRQDLVFDLDDLFEFGLARLLDGITVLAGERGGAVPPVRPAPRPRRVT